MVLLHPLGGSRGAWSATPRGRDHFWPSAAAVRSARRGGRPGSPRLTPDLGAPGRCVFPASLGPLTAEAELEAPRGERAHCGDPGPPPLRPARLWPDAAPSLPGAGAAPPAAPGPALALPPRLPSAPGPDPAWSQGSLHLAGREGRSLLTPARAASGKERSPAPRAPEGLGCAGCLRPPPPEPVSS